MLTSISPLDGRYKNEVRDLALFFSEEALMKYRLKIEIGVILFRRSPDEISP
jgi:adenylosuccinate lyase